MKGSPRITNRSLLIVALSILLLGSSFAMSTLFRYQVAMADDLPNNLPFKQRIVLKAVEEYARWHRNGTIREHDTSVTAVLKDYWSLGGIPVNERQLRDRQWQYRHPWSAVFISWVMREAGAADRFPYANAHAKYIVWATLAMKSTLVLRRLVTVSNLTVAWK